MTDLALNNIAKWDYLRHTPMIISGPCSAESEEQVLRTARELAACNVHVFRAGIWKPRTRPNAFEGIGRVGLEWLQAARRETGLPIAVEVANVKHVYEALRVNVDLLWIGARTTVNPFSVQEIADSLRGVNIPVFVKNPISPDLALWIGALERLHQVGIDRIGAIHRGFSTLGQTKYRNKPNWEIPIELKRQVPEMPIICDPSHICGRKDLIPAVAQKAMDLNFSGLMIEAHYDPPNALSDAEQQLTPQELCALLKKLVFRKATSDDAAKARLEDLREKIDHIDTEIIDILAERMNVVRDIGKVKKENKITIFQNKRWDAIIKSRVKKGLDLDLSEDFIIDLLQLIHREAIHIQTRILNEAEELRVADTKED